MDMDQFMYDLAYWFDYSLLILLVTIWEDQQQRRALNIATKVATNKKVARDASAPLWTKFFRIAPTTLASHHEKPADRFRGAAHS